MKTGVIPEYDSREISMNIKFLKEVNKVRGQLNVQLIPKHVFDKKYPETTNQKYFSEYVKLTAIFIRFLFKKCEALAIRILTTGVIPELSSRTI